VSKILLVEDNEMNRDMLSRRLLKKGFELVMAEDGEQAIEVARTESPDLILMDISLPGLDGWEATRRLKAMPPMPWPATGKNAWKPGVTTMIPSRWNFRACWAKSRGSWPSSRAISS
jgi:CheY-like chemotaxis protein